MSSSFLAFIPFLLFLILSRMQMQKANRSLDDQQKVLLIDLFSKKSPLRYVWLALLLGSLYAIWEFGLLDMYIALALYFAGLIVYSLYYGRKSLTLLKANDFPTSYIRAYMSATLFQWAGIAFMVFALIYMANGEG